ncbi:hypothetical protein RHA1_ro08425 (plasmid) [Rhodococcus jostii RHA1]|uniref:Uncharacterized protein n=1 Tax=Rhodococcus jostii (strain RHA1) TaxID=101510 RepID=Q0RZ17_RHOJR|nr:hypothetical protein RHA1_ro08425 [Rhodococcus jostii RHA1]
MGLNDALHMHTRCGGSSHDVPGGPLFCEASGLVEDDPQPRFRISSTSTGPTTSSPVRTPEMWELRHKDVGAPRSEVPPTTGPRVPGAAKAGSGDFTTLRRSCNSRPTPEGSTNGTSGLRRCQGVGVRSTQD